MIIKFYEHDKSAKKLIFFSLRKKDTHFPSEQVALLIFYTMDSSQASLQETEHVCKNQQCLTEIKISFLPVLINDAYFLCQQAVFSPFKLL